MNVFYCVCCLQNGGRCMDTTLTLVVDWNEKKVFVDGNTIELDDLNTAEMNVSKILELRNMVPSVLRLQHELEKTYIKEQIVSLFKLWGKSNTFTLRSTMDALNVDRHEALVVLKAGIDYDVLVRGFNSAWKIESKIVRESMKSCIIHLLKANRPARNAEEMLKENMERMKQENEGKLVETEHEESAQIKVGMKGTGIREESPLKKGPMKLSTISATPSEISSILLPKKKPLPIHTQDTKKSQKPAKTQKKKTVVSLPYSE